MASSLNRLLYNSFAVLNNLFKFGTRGFDWYCSIIDAIQGGSIPPCTKMVSALSRVTVYSSFLNTELTRATAKLRGVRYIQRPPVQGAIKFVVF